MKAGIRQRPSALAPAAYEEAAACLRTIAHPHRLRMIQMLLDADHSVGELAEACGIAHNVACEHLGLMRDRGLVTARRDGRKTFYLVAEPGLAGIIRCVEGRFGRRPGGEPAD